MPEEEIQLFLKPEIPVEKWREGEPILASKLKWPKIANNPVTKQIVAQKAELRKLIANNAGLVRDFEFFTTKLAWQPEGLLQDLYWDCNMMHATRQSVIAREKKGLWPIDRDTLDELYRDLSAIAAKLDRLNETSFSPARTVVLPAETGERLPSARERFYLKVFRELPEILRLYRRDLSRKILITDTYWASSKERRKSIVESVRQNSLYEKIRAKTGQYHQVRLHRLVNAARQIQGLPLLKTRAFVVWLNRLRRRCEQAKLQAAQGTKQGSS